MLPGPAAVRRGKYPTTYGWRMRGEGTRGLAEVTGRTGLLPR